MAQFSVTFDALLVGHDAGVTSVCWRPRTVGRPPALLSSSTDSSVILWSQTSIGGYTTTNSASIWVSEQRFGDVGGQRLGGFVGCLWSQGGDRAMAWGWAGGWRSWLSNSDKNGIESWTEVGAISGHRGIVRDVNWSPGGEYLISTGCSDSSDGYIFGTNVPTVHTKQRAYTHQSTGVLARQPTKRSGTKFLDRKSMAMT